MSAPSLPPWVDHLEYDAHPFSPSAFKGTPAEGRVAGEDRMAWLALDWCGNIVGIEEADWLPLPAGFDPATHRLRIERDGTVTVSPLSEVVR